MTINVLVVDPGGNLQSMMKEMLTPLECQVITASSTALAVFLARKNFPCLVVLNVNGSEGELDLPRELAADDELDPIPVVAFVPPDKLSLWQDNGLDGADRVLACPENPQTLRSVLVPYLHEKLDLREKETTE